METGEGREKVSKATLRRLPVYYRYLKDLEERGEERISSTAIASALGMNAVLVRKDLAAVTRQKGRPRLGFGTAALIRDIDAYLGYGNRNEAILVGAGALGSALAGYEGFCSYGLKIVAAFDTDPAKTGRRIGDVEIRAASEIGKYVSERNILIGILTIPKEQAQGTAEILVKAGIRAIWNFAPVRLSLPDSVAVKNEDMAGSLAVLSKRLEAILYADGQKKKDTEKEQEHGRKAR